MRAAAILGPGNIARTVLKFQRETRIEWTSLIEQADIAVLFGGDGTVHRHLPTLVELEIPLLVVPCGSGNDFAGAVNIRSLRDSICACRAFAAAGGNVRAIDLGTVHGLAGEAPALHNSREYFCCVAGIGLDARINKRANALPRWFKSNGGYALTASRELLRFAAFPMKVSPNGTAAAFRPTTLAAVANAPSYGGGMKIAPQAQLNDGKLDVCVVRAMDSFKLFCLFPTVYFGRHLGLREVEYQQTPAVKIETEYPLDVYADGEFVSQTPVEFGVAVKALKVLVP